MNLAKMVLPLIVVALVSGCTSLGGGMSGSDIQYRYQNAPLVLDYAKPDVIRDQNKVATILVPDNFGLTVDGVAIKERTGEFNHNLRLSKNDQSASYIVDVLPGDHTLAISYDRFAPSGGKGMLHGSGSSGPVSTGRSSSVSASGSMSLPLPAWSKTSDITHTFKGGEIYTIGLKENSLGKAFRILNPVVGSTIAPEVDIFPLDEGHRNIVIETRNKAEF